MPAVIPSHELVGDLKFFGVDARAWLGESDVLQHEVQRIYVELGSHVVERAHGDHASLRMIGRAPCSLRADVVNDADVLLFLVGNLDDVGKWRRASTAGSAC